MRGEDLEVDRLADNALVVAGDPICLVLDLALDVAKVGELATGYVMELGPLGAPGLCGIPICLTRVGRTVIVLDVDQL